MQLSFPGRRGALPPVVAIVLSLILPLALPFTAFAQADQQDDGAYDAPPTAGVARLDAFSGDVAIQRGDSNDTVAAVVNAPVLAADYLTTGQDGRAEVGFDGRSAVRLGENVQIRFTSVDPANRQMQLAAGTIDLRLFGDTDGQSAIDTPSVSIIPRSAGSFRVTVDNNGETAVTVRSGRADIVTPQGNQSLAPGTTLIADGPAANPSIQTQAAIALDPFDSYNGERDRTYVAATAQAPYVNQNIAGVGDLNGNGNWVDDGTNGHVWMPNNVPPNWAPYRDGNWTWEDSYGWTWVAAEPWGWAPYHYGRWYYSTAYNHWAWYPPPPGRLAPAWSPALVGFVGFNIGAVSVGVGFGNIGWVPLAPHEAFHPWWGPHGAIVNNTTIINNNNSHYRNLAVNNALTSVTRENFQAGRFNNPTVVSQERLQSLRPVSVQGALPIVPGQANLRFTQRNVAPSLASRPQQMNRSFAGTPSYVQRTPFSEQQASVSRATHLSYAPSSVPSYARPGGGAPQAPGDSWSRFNSNRGPGGYGRGEAPSYNNRGAMPSYAHQAGGSNGYTRPESQGYPQYNRQSAPGYNRSSSSSYERPAPSYNRSAGSGYSGYSGYGRAQGSGYSRPATARPSARATHSSEGHRN